MVDFLQPMETDPDEGQQAGGPLLQVHGDASGSPSTSLAAAGAGPSTATVEAQQPAQPTTAATREQLAAEALQAFISTNYIPAPTQEDRSQADHTAVVMLKYGRTASDLSFVDLVFNKLHLSG